MIRECCSKLFDQSGIGERVPIELDGRFAPRHKVATNSVAAQCWRHLSPATFLLRIRCEMACDDSLLSIQERNCFACDALVRRGAETM